MAATPRSVCYRFGRAELQPAQRRLLIDGTATPLAGRAFELLVLLVERAGSLVTKDEILDRVWAGLVVEENNLQVQVSTLRKLLGAAAIETVPGRGYRFVPQVARAEEAEPAQGVRRSNLPRQLTSFVAREGLIAECLQLLDTTRLLTLTGVGGLGKTRLSLEMAGACADTYADGVWFIDLSPVTDARLVSETVALVVGIAEQTTGRLIDVMRRFMQDRRMLLILDNCEHLLAGCAELAKSLLTGGEHLKILATSREPLHVAGEAVYPLPTLSLPDAREPCSVEDLGRYEAVRLFVDRARAARPGFELTERNAQAVRAICAHLDGIPLALELAAANVRALPIETIAERLHDRFRLLKGRDSTAPTRQQTLRATIDWSYDHLTEPEQRVLQRASVFAGGWTLAAAEAVCGGGEIDPADVLDLHSGLVEKSLVTVEAEGSRYNLLETVRQYAQERLEATGDGDDARTRHLDFHVGLAEQARSHFVGPEEDAWLARFDLERPNLLAAYAWSRKVDGGAAAALRMAYGAEAWMCRGAFDLGHPVLAQELAEIRASENVRLRCQGLLAAAFLSFYAGDYEDCCRYGEEALTLAKEVGDVTFAYEAMCRSGMGYLAGDHAAARRHLDESFALARQANSSVRLNDALILGGELESIEGSLEKAEEYYEASLASARELGSRLLTIVGLMNLARISISRGSIAPAVALLREALIVADQAQSRRQAPYFLAWCAGLAARLGDPARAARFHGASQRQLEEMLLRLEPTDYHALAPLFAEARATLNPTEWASAEAAGFALRREDALAELRAWLAQLA
jgi:predicted ATPase/DNA-binding winged helix-turn-helix (wHTH) protein